jgi:hypothetical protein
MVFSSSRFIAAIVAQVRARRNVPGEVEPALQSEPEQPIPEKTAKPSAPSNPFAVPDQTQEELAAVRRQTTKRIAVWGIATGVLMALLVIACLALLLAAQGSGH